ncbi:MAG TPA: DUF924 domain-containing protein [Aliiroseovarius sp.]|nr:DUF924 domain-containing protein [Aliiroseovarius sp.]
MSDPEDILAFWLDEVGPSGWYESTPELDQKIRDRFYDTWQQAQEGALSLWLTYPTGVLAYVILLDQFPRNMFRDDKRAFSTDMAALEAAKCAVKKGWDMRIDEPARQFFYMPMMHSENLCDQNRCVRLMVARMPETGRSNLLHAKAHREVIRQFGRFPYRNSALSRSSTGPEIAFVDDGGYRSVIERLSA